MALLNEGIEWDELDKHFDADIVGQVQRAFSHTPNRVRISVHDELFRFGDSSTARRSRVPAWWAFVEGRNPRDRGIAPVEQARARGESISQYARARLAVDHGWGSAMDVLIKLRLSAPVCGFYGATRSQQYDSSNKDLDNVAFIGGDWQLWIPNLEYSKHVLAMIEERVS